MANWTAVRLLTAPRNKAGDIQYEEGPNPRIELPNLVLYVDYVDLDDKGRGFTPDGRSAKSVAVYSDSLALILNFVAKECARFNALDAGRISALQSELDAVNLPGDGTLALPTLPDTSKQDAIAAAGRDLLVSVSAALVQKGTNLTKEQIAAAAAIDPTVNDKLAALEAAQADVAQAIGP